MNLKQLLFLKCASGSRELSFTYTLGAYIERYGTDPYVRTACSPYVSSTPNRYAAGYVTNQEYYAIQNKLEDEVDKYPIRFGDANKIILDVPDYIRATVFFVTSLEKTGGYAKFIDGDINPYDSNVPLGRREIVIPEGADSFGFSLFYPNGLITDDIMKSIKVKAIKADWIERLITGNPVSFTPNAERDLLKFDVPLTYSQSGSGDPSPSNVRPITGISGFTIWRTGKNLWNYQLGNGNIGSHGETIVSSPKRLISSFINLGGSGERSFTFSYSGDFQFAVYAYETDDENTFISGESLATWNDNGTSFTLTEARYIRFKLKNASDTNISPSDVTNIQLELVDIATTYEPYTGEEYNIAFPALGKNLFDANSVIRRDGYLLDDNGVEQTTTQSGYTLSKTPVNPGETYVISGTLVSGSETFRIYFYSDESTFVSRTDSVGASYVPYKIMIPEGCHYIAIQYNKTHVDFSTVQIERAINILQNKTAVRGTTSIYIGQDTANVYPNHLVAGTLYSMSYECDGTREPQIYIQENGESAVLAGSGKKFTFSPAKTGDYRMYVYVQDGVTSVTNFQLSTATKYEPYNNTVYGGSLDVTTGVLSITHAYKKFVGTGESWEISSGNTGVFVIAWSEVKNKKVTACNMSPPNNETGNIPAYGYVYNQDSAYNIRTHIVDQDMTISEFKAWLAEHPLELVCPLVNPVTVQLDPVTIQTLIGTNTIWTNTNGSNTIKYLKKEG